MKLANKLQWLPKLWALSVPSRNSERFPLNQLTDEKMLPISVLRPRKYLENYFCSLGFSDVPCKSQGFDPKLLDVSSAYF